MIVGVAVTVGDRNVVGVTVLVGVGVTVVVGVTVGVGVSVGVGVAVGVGVSVGVGVNVWAWTLDETNNTKMTSSGRLAFTRVLLTRYSRFNRAMSVTAAVASDVAIALASIRLSYNRRGNHIRETLTPQMGIRLQRCATLDERSHVVSSGSKGVA